MIMAISLADPKTHPFRADLTTKILQQAIEALLVRRYYGKTYEDRLDYHHQTTNEIMRLVEEQLTRS